MNLVIFDSTTGEIKRMTSSAIKEQNQEGESVIEVPSLDNLSDLTHYVTVPGLTLTTKYDYTLESLPIPCTITVEGVEYPCTEQPTFSFTPAGDYEIEVDAGVQYLKKTFTYTQV